MAGIPLILDTISANSRPSSEAIFKATGLETLHCPLTELYYLPGYRNYFDSALNEDQYDAAIFTSRFAAKAVAELETDLPQRIYCVGESTANEIQALIQRDIKFPAVSNENHLAKLITKELDMGAKVILPCGELNDGILKAKLGSKGIFTREVKIYGNRIPKDASRSLMEVLPLVDIVLFSSPSAVDNFFKITGPTGNIIDKQFGCLGVKTRKALEKYGIQPAFVPADSAMKSFALSCMNYIILR